MLTASLIHSAAEGKVLQMLLLLLLLLVKTKQ